MGTFAQEKCPLYKDSYKMLLSNRLPLSSIRQSPSHLSQESSQEIGLTKDRYLGGRLATSLHTGQCMEKLRFAHQAPVI